MAYSLIEFGLSEFGSYEFGFEQGNLVIGTTLHASSHGSVGFSTQVLNNTEAITFGSSVLFFDSETVKVTTLGNIAGTSSAVFDGTRVLNTLLTSENKSDAYFNPSYIIDASMHGDGFGDFLAIYVDPETFDARGKSTVKFITGYGFATDVLFSGSSKATIDNFAYSDSVVTSESTCKVNLLPGFWSVADLVSKGVGSSTVHTRSIHTSSLVSNGVSNLTLKMQQIGTARFRSDGLSTGQFKTQRYFIVGLGSVGLSDVAFKADTVTAASFESIGMSFVNLKPGSPVSSYLPPAWDTVIRPYENRLVNWK